MFEFDYKRIWCFGSNFEISKLLFCKTFLARTSLFLWRFQNVPVYFIEHFLGIPVSFWIRGAQKYFNNRIEFLHDAHFVCVHPWKFLSVGIFSNSLNTCRALTIIMQKRYWGDSRSLALGLWFFTTLRTASSYFSPRWVHDAITLKIIDLRFEVECSRVPIIQIKNNKKTRIKIAPHEFLAEYYAVFALRKVYAHKKL